MIHDNEQHPWQFGQHASLDASDVARGQQAQQGIAPGAFVGGGLLPQASISQRQTAAVNAPQAVSGVSAALNRQRDAQACLKSALSALVDRLESSGALRVMPTRGETGGPPVPASASSGLASVVDDQTADTRLCLDVVTTLLQRLDL